MAAIGNTNRRCESICSSSGSVEDELVKVFSSRTGFLCLFFFILTIHIALSCGSYSGRHTPPMFGDFEAQRHWMELTIHLPVKEWYVNGSDNDLNYWGLDYPPLTAFHSFLLGKISDKINRSWVALHESRGIETDAHKLFMRLSVMVSMWALYIPALMAFVFLSSNNQNIYYFAISILYPALIAVDNGHFQYNHISLGLFIVAVVCLISNKRAIGSMLFVMALNFKQMELYHSLPIATFLFAKSIRLPCNAGNAIHSLTELTKLFLIVVATFLLLWWPFIATNADLWQILHRIFPFYRGIFEDKVANLWCALNVIVKLHNREMATLIKLSTFVVVCTHIPTICALLLQPNVSTFKNTLFVSSLSFFLFSFQVHEKSILLAAVPAILIWPERPVAISWFLIISNASVFPLCVKDGNALHLAMLVSYFILIYPTFTKLAFAKWLLVQCSCAMSIVLCLASLILPPPVRYPHIFPLLNAVFCFAHFIMFSMYFNYVTLEEAFRCKHDQKAKCE